MIDRIAREHYYESEPGAIATGLLFHVRTGSDSDWVPIRWSSDS